MRTVVTIDTLEEDRVVLDTPQGPARIPRALLPAGAKEGDRLTWTLELDADGTRKAKQEIDATRKKIAVDPGDVTEI